MTTTADAATDRWPLIDPALQAVARQARDLELEPDAVLARLEQTLKEYSP